MLWQRSWKTIGAMADRSPFGATASLFGFPPQMQVRCAKCRRPIEPGSRNAEASGADFDEGQEVPAWKFLASLRLGVFALKVLL